MGWMFDALPLLFYSQERDLVPIKQEAGWASGLVWMGRVNPAPTGV